MALNILEEDEQIIQLLEEIDSNYSSVRVLLRDMRVKIGRLSVQNKQVINDCEPWIKFFESGFRNGHSPISELHFSSSKFKELENSPNLLNYSAPKNPFVEIETSELFNKSLLKSFKSSVTSESSISSLVHEATPSKANVTVCDSEENDLQIRNFDIKEIPSIFQNEKGLFDLFKFIQSNRSVALEIVSKSFDFLPPEKLDIFISLLCRKQFIKQKNGKLTVE